MKKLQRRYQRWGVNGIEWSKWYDVEPTRPRDPWELKNKLKAEFREVDI